MFKVRLSFFKGILVFAFLTGLSVGLFLSTNDAYARISLEDLQVQITDQQMQIDDIIDGDTPIYVKVSTFSGDQALTLDDQGLIVMTGNGTLTLPDVVNAKGGRYIIRNEAAGIITIIQYNGSTIAQVTDENLITQVVSDGVVWFEKPTKGPKGDKGDTGETGPQGIQGDTGPQGIQGETGPQGIQGETGPQGIQGETGPQGIQGETGPQGIQGETGPQGIQGETGPQGPAGADGALADLTCAEGQVAVYNGMTWVCADIDTTSTTSSIFADCWSNIATVTQNFGVEIDNGDLDETWNDYCGGKVVFDLYSDGTLGSQEVTELVLVGKAQSKSAPYLFSTDSFNTDLYPNSNVQNISISPLVIYPGGADPVQIEMEVVVLSGESQFDWWEEASEGNVISKDIVINAIDSLQGQLQMTYSFTDCIPIAFKQYPGREKIKILGRVNVINTMRLDIRTWLNSAIGGTVTYGDIGIHWFEADEEIGFETYGDCLPTGYYFPYFDISNDDVIEEIITFKPGTYEAQ